MEVYDENEQQIVLVLGSCSDPTIGYGWFRDAEVIMGKANVDPAELRRFARDLTRFNSDLETLLVGLQGRLKELERSWADQEQRRFAQEFELTVKTLRRFLDASTQHVTFLAKKAGHIEDYLQQR
jgi:uncharacterized protein YukE